MDSPWIGTTTTTTSTSPEQHVGHAITSSQLGQPQNVRLQPPQALSAYQWNQQSNPPAPLPLWNASQSMPSSSYTQAPRPFYYTNIVNSPQFYHNSYSHPNQGLSNQSMPSSSYTQAPRPVNYTNIVNSPQSYHNSYSHPNQGLLSHHLNNPRHSSSTNLPGQAIVQPQPIPHRAHTEAYNYCSFPPNHTQPPWNVSPVNQQQPCFHGPPPAHTQRHNVKRGFPPASGVPSHGSHPQINVHGSHVQSNVHASHHNQQHSSQPPPAHSLSHVGPHSGNPTNQLGNASLPITYGGPVCSTTNLPLYNQQESEDYWKRCVQIWYPKRRTHSYFFPPLHFRRQQYRVETIANLPVLVHETPPLKAAPDFYPPQTTQSQPATVSQSAQPQSSQYQPQPGPSNTAFPQTSQPSTSTTAAPQPVQPQPEQVAGTVWTLPQGQPAPLPQHQKTAVTDDEANEHILYCLRVLGKHDDTVNSEKSSKKTARKGQKRRNAESEQERQEDVNERGGMVVISQLEFRKYLDNNTDPISTVACNNLPRPVTLGPNYHDGEVDVLIVHSQYRLIVMEVKAVGADRSWVEQPHDLKKVVVKTLSKALKQLDKAEYRLHHMTSDMATVNVIKTLVLPYITSDELRTILDTEYKLKEELCTCMGSADVAVALGRCLCADQMPTMEQLHTLISSSGDVQAQDKMSSLMSWWTNVTEHNNRPLPHLSDDSYDQLLARFCGPATSVEIPTVSAPRLAVGTKWKKGGIEETIYTPPTKVLRTTGEAIAETGLILSTLALYPEQVDLLNDNTLTNVHLCGPPGTGKTVVLVLKGIQWLHQGHYVLVLSTRRSTRDSDGRAVSMLIENQLQQVCDSIPQPERPSVQRVHIERYKDFSVYFLNEDSDVNKVASMANDGQLYIIADEVQDEDFFGNYFKAFLDKLSTKVQSLSVWCASVKKLSELPTGMTERELTVPLRTPPVVTREVNNSTQMGPQNSEEKQRLKRYYNREVKQNKRSGQPVVSFSDFIKQQTSNLPEDKVMVNKYTIPSTPASTDGPEITWLSHKGQPGHDEGTPDECIKCGHNIADLLTEFGVGESGGLHYREVFILADHQIIDTSPILKGLRDRGIPVKVVYDDSNDDDKRDMALARENTVIASDFLTVSGLERRIVIGTDTGIAGISGILRLYAMSRCTSQLVWIDGKATRQKGKKPQSEASEQGSLKEGSPQEGSSEQGSTSQPGSAYSQDIGSTPQSVSWADMEEDLSLSSQ